MVELQITERGNDWHRPIAINRAYKFGMRLLFDTGATIPVWTAGANELRKYFPGAVMTRYRCLLGGFGGEGSNVPVYRIPKFVIRDLKGQHVEFKDLYMALSDRNGRYDCILSYNLFRPMNLHFDGINGSYIRIDNPESVYEAQPEFRLLSEMSPTIDLSAMGLKDGMYLIRQEVLFQDGPAEKTDCFG